MTSQINPNNIDGAYPVAGQDNNSQGLRDNFTNTSTNFQYAYDEITNLQQNAVLKAALTGTTLNNDMGTNILSNATLQNMAYTSTSLGSLSSTVTLNYSLGPTFSVTTNGPIQLAFTNLPAAGRTGAWSLTVTVASTAHTLTFPVSISVNDAGIQGLNPATNIMTFAATGTYTFAFTTNNGGSTVTLNQTNNQLVPLNNSSSVLSATGNVSLATTTTLITTSANITSILNTGVSGQIINLIYANTAGGNTRVTVVNAGWKTSGNGIANLNATGSAATFQYTNSHWYCIGNNGVTFS
jgi:hypothetical protein